MIQLQIGACHEKCKEMFNFSATPQMKSESETYCYMLGKNLFSFLTGFDILIIALGVIKTKD